MNPKIALTIAGSDSSGGAGIQADLKTFAALEVHGISVITSVTSQNTQEVKEISNLSREFVGNQIDTLVSDFDIDWAKTGMVSNANIIDTIIEKVREHDIKLVVDPVMKAASGSSLINKNALEALKDLIGEAKLVTPNIEEANKLSGTKVKSVEDMRSAAEEIAVLGPENILIKGGHLDEPEIHNLLLYGNDFTEFITPRVSAPKVHGTGCTFSAAITAELAKGKDMRTAVKKAGDYMVDTVKKRLKIGKESDIANPMARKWKVTWGGEEVEQVQKATQTLTDHPEFTKLIPEVGVNIAMAPRDAQRKEDVIGLAGRIIKVEGRPHLSGPPKPGGSEHMANLIMTVIKHDPQYRAAMNIRYSDKILEKCKDLSFDTASFDRENEPSGVKTMKWGPEKAIEEAGKVPDIIYDEGAVGKEPMIRIIDKKATEVAKKAIEIAKELEK